MHALFQVAQSHLENYYCDSQNAPAAWGINPLPNTSNLLVLQVIAVLKLLQVQYLNNNTTATFTKTLVRSGTLSARCITLLSPHNKLGESNISIPLLAEVHIERQSEKSFAPGHLAAGGAWHTGNAAGLVLFYTRGRCWDVHTDLNFHTLAFL